MAEEVPTLRKGSATAAEIYTAVGIALSWWEASEDILMGVFSTICAKREPTAFELYVSSGRAVRENMLKSALKRYPDHFLPDEVEIIRKAMGALKGLAQMRNQIAHGHVSHTRVINNGVVTLEGHFLVPSLNERGHIIDRDMRYAHTAEEVNAWRDKVRAERAKIMDVEQAATIREQNAQAELAHEDRHTLAMAEAIAERRIPASAFKFEAREEQ